MASLASTLGVLSVASCTLLACKTIPSGASLSSSEVASNGTCGDPRPKEAERVVITSPTAATSQKFYFKLVCGRIWYKANLSQSFPDPNPPKEIWTRNKLGQATKTSVPSVVGRPPNWTLFDSKGLPVVEGTATEDLPDANAIKWISADGDNLIAIGNDNQLFYTKTDPNTDKPGWLTKWGKPAKVTYIAKDTVALGISHRGLSETCGYNGVNGTFVECGVGITTFYAAAKEPGGYTPISYGDSWLVGGSLDFHVAAPLNSRFAIEGMDVAASTLFVIDRAGRMFTRLYDWDTAGANIFLKYSDEVEGEQVTEQGTHYDTYFKNYLKIVRDIPAEPWAAQPLILPRGKARISKQITIVQTCNGDAQCTANSSRELRVGGLNENGERGYYVKQIFSQNCKVMKDLRTCRLNNPESDRWQFITDDSISIADDAWIDSAKIQQVAAMVANTPLDFTKSIEFETNPVVTRDYSGTMTYCNNGADCKTLPVTLRNYHAYGDDISLAFDMGGKQIVAKVDRYDKFLPAGLKSIFSKGVAANDGKIFQSATIKFPPREDHAENAEFQRFIRYLDDRVSLRLSIKRDDVGNVTMSDLFDENNFKLKFEEKTSRPSAG